MENNQDFVIENGVLTKYNGPGGDVTIPESVTTIGESAFSGCMSLTSVTIPEGVTNIKRGAFSGCANLTSVTIPGSVTEIGGWAFSSCKSLTSVTIPNGVTTIERNAFSGCANLTSVTIPAGVTEIGSQAFYCCTSLTSVTIPAGVTGIGSWAFEDCKSLTSITIPESITKIGKDIFKGCCSALIAPHIPISDFAVADKPSACAGFAKRYLEQAELDEKIKAGYLKYIKGQQQKLYPVAVKHEELLRLMFAEKMIVRKDIDLLLDECDQQNNVTAKAAVLDYAGRNLKPVDPFNEMEKELAKTERIAAHLEKTGSLPIGELKKCWSWETKDTKEGTFVTLTSWKGKDGPCVTVPEKIGENPVKAIGSSAFSPEGKPKAIREAREALQSVTIPAGVTEIGSQAFYCCKNLTSVTIPEGVTEIGSWAFAFCTNLTSVTIPESVKKIGGSAFYCCTNLTSVTITGSKEIDKSVFEDCRPALIALYTPISRIAKEDKPGACRGFAKAYLDGTALDDEIKAGYLKYIKGQKKRLFPLSIQHEELLQLMFAEKMIVRKDIDILLDECDKQNNVAAKAAVLEYAGKNLKPVDPLKEFKLKDL